VDVTKAVRLPENKDAAFTGGTKGGAFDVSGDTAREWLRLPLNPNGGSNANVLRPWMNGTDVTRRHSGKWIIDFGWRMSEQEASPFEVPFGYTAQHIPPAARCKAGSGIRQAGVGSRKASPRQVEASSSSRAIHRNADSYE
jgi:hypothetical protein